MKNSFKTALLLLWAGLGILCCGGVAAQKAPSFRHPEQNRWLEEAADLTLRMRELAVDDKAPRLFVSDSDILDYMRQMGAGNYSTLQRVRVAEFSSDKLAEGFMRQTLYYDEQLTAEECEDLRQKLKNRMTPGVLISVLNGQEGMTHLAANAVLSFDRTYMQPEDWREDLLLVLDYGGEYASAVAFWQSGEGTVTGRAAFIVARRADALFEVLNQYYNGEPVPIRELTGEDLKKPSL